MSEETGRRFDVYTVTYAPWEEGADEREKTGEGHRVHPCEPDDIDRDEGLSAVDIAVTALRTKLFATDYSASEWQRHGWWSSTQPYEHAYTGELEEVTVHLRDFTEDESREIYRRVTSAA